MKILHAIPSLGVGGAERQLSYLAPALVDAGHEVHVAHSRPVDISPFSDSVTLHRLESTSNYDPRLVWALLRLMREIKPDVLHTWILQMDIIGGIAARLTGTPWILREASSALAYSRSWKNALRVRIASGANSIVSNSQGGDDYWRGYLPRARRQVIRNGLPIEQIDDAPVRLPRGMDPIDAPIVLVVGRLSSDRSGNKNLNVFLQALAGIDANMELIGFICGNGPQRPELEAMASRLGLGARVRFTGELDPSLVWALMKSASVFVSLSEFEGCPNSVLEAIVCECPVVLSDIPAHREIVDETCACFVDQTSPDNVAAKLVETLKDPASARARARIARRRCAAWSVVEMARGFECVYASVIQPMDNSEKTCELS